MHKRAEWETAKPAECCAKNAFVRGAKGDLLVAAMSAATQGMASSWMLCRHSSLPASAAGFLRAFPHNSVYLCHS